MSKLIQALQIFLKYGDPEYPTSCIHDELVVLINPAIVSQEDIAALHEFGFYTSEEGHFYSFRYGSA